MLASITPLGERGRQSRWGLTATAFLIGATGAGAAWGAIIGTLGQVVLVGHLGVPARLAVLAVAFPVAAALDLLPPGVPGPRRQVNERWLDEFRGWVYGLGFGVQLGLGVTTVISSAATYVALVAAFLAGPALGAVIVGAFGLTRGLEPLAAAHVKRPDQLLAMHARLDRWRGPVRGLVVALLALAALVAIIGSVA